jgi:hypothetical protein
MSPATTTTVVRPTTSTTARRVAATTSSTFYWDKPICQQYQATMDRQLAANNTDGYLVTYDKAGRAGCNGPGWTPVGSSSSGGTSSGGKCTWVNGYTRKDGTYVKGHSRGC